MYCKQLNSRSIEWSKISLENSSFRNEAKNYKGLFLNKFERAGIYLWFGQYDIQNQALEICPNPKGRFQGLDFAILKFKVE